MSTRFSERGGEWVVIQFVLMALVLVLSPLVRQDWGNPITDAAAAGLFALAAVTGLLGVRELRGNRTVFPLPKGGSALITTGIYGYLRHPLYVAVMAMSFGWALAWSSGVGITVSVTTLFFLNAKAVHEERLLRAKFPGYADYARRVKRFIPGLY